jgi:hypothetical protein
MRHEVDSTWLLKINEYYFHRWKYFKLILTILKNVEESYNEELNIIRIL